MSVVPPEVMRVLETGGKGAGEEIRMTDAIAQTIGQPFPRRHLRGPRFGCGIKTGFVEAPLVPALICQCEVL